MSKLLKPLRSDPMNSDFVIAEYLTYYLIAINLFTFTAFGIDKAKAEAGHRRISEANLLSWAMMGGTPAAYAARALFRHKTRKQPFSSHLHMILVVQLALLGFLAYTLAFPA
ncbi:MAG: DUF1294 domain-containing protein [Qipengyuania vulgaris]